VFDVAIAGGGLCGLALAEALSGQGLAVVLIEARERLGGRILTGTSESSGLAVDLGAGWFWPQAQPLLRDLVKQHGLRAFPQYDQGVVLSLGDPDQGPQQVGADPVHGGAYRIAGGAGALVAALAERIEAMVRTGVSLEQLHDAGDHISLSLRSATGSEEILARQVVLALPPRLAAHNVSFSPPLPGEILSAMQQTPTWMAASAKAVQAYQAGGWRVAGLSGSAFVHNAQAVLAEVFDACDAGGEHTALGGFLALTPDLRARFALGLPMLIANQFAQLFGPEYELGELLYHDWAGEPLTCAPADRAELAREHPAPADPLLRQPHWGGKLHFGGSETAAREPGYMEGALDAAGRLAIALRETLALSAVASAPANRLAIARFTGWVEGQHAPAMALYERRITQRLASQQRGQLTQLALLETLEAVFAAALDQLAGYGFETGDVPVEQGRSALTPLVQAPFRGLLAGLIEDVMRFNAGSCALSNFPGEHRPSKEYTEVILRDIAAAWVEFSQAANALLIRGAR